MLKRRAIAIGTAVLATLISIAARAEEPESPLPTPLDGLGENLADAFRGYNLLYFEGAVGATGVMAFSGVDHAVRVEFVRNLQVQAWGNAAYVAGYAVPITTPAIWIVGLVLRDRALAGAGSAAVQAALTTVATTTALKVMTGRPYPLHGGDPNASDRLDHAGYADEFRPFRNGIGAWPSGHTAPAVSIAAALTAYAPEHLWIPAIGYPLGLAIGIGMVDRDSHWASDVVAGALIGHAIGWSIGKNFRRRVRGEPPSAAFELVPMAGAQGLMLRAEW